MLGFLFAFAYREKIENGELQFSTFLNKRLYRLVPLLVVTTLVIFSVRFFYEHQYDLSLVCVEGGDSDCNTDIFTNLVSDWISVSIAFTYTGMILGDISFDLYLWNCPILLIVLFLHIYTMKPD